MDDDNNILSNEDLEMLNSVTASTVAADLSTPDQHLNFNRVSNSNSSSSGRLGQISSPHSNNTNMGDEATTTTTTNHTFGDQMDEDDENFMLETETKTPGEILEEFCAKLSDVNTTLPENVINYYMRKTGFIVNDPKLVKLVSLAGQKFISEIVNDVMQHHKLRTKSAAAAAAAVAGSASDANAAAATGAAASGSNTATTTAAAAPTTSGSNTSLSNAKATKAAATAAANTTLTLTLEDLTYVLTEYGINVKKPYYFT